MGFSNEMSAQTNAAIAVAEQREAAESGDALIEFGNALEVSDLILGEAAWPAADGCQRGIR